MSVASSRRDKGPDAAPIEIAERVWWVGHYLPGDTFQCHVYLIEHGDQSVLIDPGSNLTFPDTLRKIEQVLPFSAIRYFVCHHADPDISAALPDLDRLVQRPDAVLVTHWRSAALLKHYRLRLPFWLVEDHDWQLDLGERRLEFTFTPYLHFAGAFTTFDERTGTLFSSDIFGGFTDEWTLWAEDEDYFEAIRPFLEHYVPSREVLAHGSDALRRLPIRAIAPQHGSLIPERLVELIMDRARELDCGLWLIVDRDADIRRRCVRAARRIRRRANGRLADSRRRAARAGRALLAAPPAGRAAARRRPPPGGPTGVPPGTAAALPDRGTVRAAAVWYLDRPAAIDAETAAVLRDISLPLEVAVQRELMVRSVQLQRRRLLERSLHDPLTGLHNRSALDGLAARLLDADQRDPSPGLCAVLVDIDHFKAVNDTFGHSAGDAVLRRVAGVLARSVRGGDLAVRLGGEEFALLLRAPLAGALRVADRVREQIAGLRFDLPVEGHRVTISAGVARRRPGDDLAGLVDRADVLLYQAKADGRNRVVGESETGGPPVRGLNRKRGENRNRGLNRKRGENRNRGVDPNRGVDRERDGG